MMMMSEGGESVQVKFVTREAQYSVPGDAIALDAQVTPDQLSALVNQLLDHSDEDHEQVEFEFLIQDQILHGSVKDHLDEHGLGTENLVEIEYVEKCPCPDPLDSLVHDDWVSSVHCMRVGERSLVLTGSYDCSVAIWTVAGKKLITLPGHTSPVKAVRWVDFDGTFARFVSTSHDETALLWKWHADKNIVDTVVVCKGHERSVDCVDVDPQLNRFATSGFDSIVKVWSTACEETELDVVKKEADEETEMKKARQEEQRPAKHNKVTRTPLVSLASHTEAVTALQFVSSAEMLTCSMDCTLKLWDVEVGGFSNQLLGSKAFFDLSYSKLSRSVVTAHADRHIRLWDPRSNQGSVVKANFTSHVGWVTSVCWSPCIETQFISGSYDSLVKLWDTRSTKAPLYDMEGHEDKVLSCDWSLHDLMASGGADNKLRLFKHTAPTAN